MGFNVGKCAKKLDGIGIINYTHSAAVTAWTPLFIANLGYFIAIASAAASTKAAYYFKGTFNFIIANSVAVAIGNHVYYDETNGVITTTKPTTGYLIGTALSAGTGNAGGTVVAEVALNEFFGESGNLQAIDISTTQQMFSDCDDTGLTCTDDETLTTAQVLGGFFPVDPGGADRDLTTPTAAAIVAAINQPKADTSCLLVLKNTADAAETLTVVGGTGVTVTGTATIAQNNTKIFLVRLDNVTSGSEAVTVYSVGTLVH